MSMLANSAVGKPSQYRDGSVQSAPANAKSSSCSITVATEAAANVRLVPSTDA